MASSTPGNVPTPITTERNDTMSLDASASNSAPSVAKNSNEPVGFFPWYKLSCELRDMIYDQPCMLEDKIVCEQRLKRDDDDYYDDLSRRVRAVATKPRVNLKLVSHQFGNEYSERCDGQKKFFVRADPGSMFWTCWSENTAEHMNVLDLHLGEFDFEGLTPQGVLDEFGDLEWQLIKLCRALPRLRAVNLKLYVGNYNIQLGPFEAYLRSMVSLLDKLKRLKIISCDYPEKCWDLSSRKHVLVDWKAEELKAPTVITGRASTIEYAESCCEGLVHESRQWDGEPEWDYEGNYIGDDKTFPMGRTYY